MCYNRALQKITTKESRQMFKANHKHLQADLFGYENLLSDSMRQKLLESAEYSFYKLVFCNIHEDDFACLYSEIESRPNAPVNCLVAALLLADRRNWSREELMRRIQFDLLSKTALGLHNLDEAPFTERTLFYFQDRINDHFARTGINLLEQTFDRLTKKQMKDLKIKADIQRTDSFQAGSNIRVYTRLRLLVEMIIRIHRILSEDDRKQQAVLFEPYVTKTSGKYVYSVAPGDLSREMEAIGLAYHRIATEIRPRYTEYELFETFDRVYAEQFMVINDAIVVRPNADMTSDSLQSPDDEDATYREKGKTEHRGQVVNIVETANPDNEFQLITDVAVAPNNMDDSRVLNERLSGLKEKTPDLNELHTDGAYPSQDNDNLCGELGITMVQTGIKGPKSDDVELTIDRNDQKEYIVSCPQQTVVAEQTPSRHKACFDAAKCAVCPLAKTCRHASGRYYFTDEDYLRKQRQAAIKNIPKERRTLRANVEATVYECKRGMNNGKLKVRGHFKTALYSFGRAIMVNFGRIYRYLMKKAGNSVQPGRLSPVPG